MRKQYERLMKRCINLAKKSQGNVSPNPLVAAIVFDDDFNILSSGRHEKYGENHAERNAILNYKGDLKDKSIIVNLEPCSHFGKTPPCSDLIIEKGIKKVVIGMIDPNPIVSGRGIKKLKKAGIEVVTGILEEECKKLNKIFLKNQLEKKPYITIKTAVTLDGKIASRTGSSKWITDEMSRKEVQKLRNQYDAVLTSSSTIKIDNPSLTCRMKNGRNPVRIILDTKLTTPKESKVYNQDGTRIIVVVGESVSDKQINKHAKGVEYIKCPEKNGHIDIVKAVEYIYNAGIKSILVEAGGILNKSFIEEKMVDELIQFIAPKILGDKSAKSNVEGFNRNLISECNNLSIVSTRKLKNDIMVTCLFWHV